MGSGNAGSQVDGAQTHAEARGPTLVRTAQRRPRVLMLEDNLLFARMTRKVLKSCVEVTIVATAHAAMDRLGRGKAWSGFVFDIGLPDGSGLDVLREAPQGAPHGAGPGHFGLDPTGRRQRGVPAGRAVPGQAVQGGRDRGGRREAPSQLVAAGGHGRGAGRRGGGRPGNPSRRAAGARHRRARGGRPHGQADARRNYRLAALAKAANGLPNDAATTYDACANAAGVSRQTLQDTRRSPRAGALSRLPGCSRSRIARGRR